MIYKKYGNSEIVYYFDNVFAFGSEEIKMLLLNIVDNPEDADAALRIHDSIQMYTIKKLETGFSEGEFTIKGGIKNKPLYTSSIIKDDYPDIVGDVYIKVINKLPDFIKTVEEKNYDEKSRQAWLRIIVYCVIAKHLNKVGLLDFIIDIDENDDDESGVKYIPSEDFKKEELRIEAAEKITEMVKIASEYNGKPEKILAFYYNSLIYREIYSRNKNGCAAKTGEYMNGKILFLLKENFLPMFNENYTMDLPKSSIEGVSKVVGFNEASETGKSVFDANTKTITDWSNRIKTYVVSQMINY